jgi:hypothetical protein
VGGTGREVVVAVPAAIAVGPVQAPLVGAGVVAELGDAYLGPFGQIGLPQGTAVEHGYRAAADAGFDPDLVAQAGWDRVWQYFWILARSVSGGAGIRPR